MCFLPHVVLWKPRAVLQAHAWEIERTAQQAFSELTSALAFLYFFFLPVIVSSSFKKWLYSMSVGHLPFGVGWARNKFT